MQRQPTPRKYDPLAAYFAGLDRDQVVLSLTEIEQIIGQALPRSARARSWWANTSGRTSSRAWLAAGWAVVMADLRNGGETVTFARRSAGTGCQPSGCQ